MLNLLFQELCLKIIPTFADLIDYSALKNSIVPRIKKLCLSTSAIEVSKTTLFSVLFREVKKMHTLPSLNHSLLE